MLYRAETACLLYPSHISPAALDLNVLLAASSISRDHLILANAVFTHVVPVEKYSSAAREKVPYWEHSSYNKSTAMPQVSKYLV